MRKYSWGINHQLKSIARGNAETKYIYDDYGNLAQSDFNTETIFKSMDLLGNIYETKEHTDREYGCGGLLLKSNKAQYEYDECGNLTQKITKDGMWKWFYE